MGLYWENGKEKRNHNLCMQSELLFTVKGLGQVDRIWGIRGS